MKKDTRLKTLAFNYAEQLKRAGPNTKQVINLEDLYGSTAETTLN